jgi:hypothetical protein
MMANSVQNKFRTKAAMVAAFFFYGSCVTLLRVLLSIMAGARRSFGFRRDSLVLLSPMCPRAAG